MKKKKKIRLITYLESFNKVWIFNSLYTYLLKKQVHHMKYYLKIPNASGNLFRNSLFFYTWFASLISNLQI